MQLPGASQERCGDQEVAVAAVVPSRSVTEANKQQFLGAQQEHCRSVAETRKQQLQRPRALQELGRGQETAGVLQQRCRGQEVAVATFAVSRSFTGALQRPRSSSVQELSRSVAKARKQQLYRPGALQQEHRKDLEAAIAASRRFMTLGLGRVGVLLWFTFFWCRYIFDASACFPAVGLVVL